MVEKGKVLQNKDGLMSATPEATNYQAKNLVDEVWVCVQDEHGWCDSTMDKKVSFILTLVRNQTNSLPVW